MKANKVEEDIEKASKVGKQVKWQVLDIKAKQTKKNGEVFDVSFLSLFFLAHSSPVTEAFKICRRRPWGSSKKPKELHVRQC